MTHLSEGLIERLEGAEVGSREQLTAAEQRCCHMSQWDGSSLAGWRMEFGRIHRSEHCRDCPLLKALPKNEGEQG